MAEWLPYSYVVNQVAIIVLGLWAIVHRESVIQVELLMVIKAFSVILDAIAIGMYFQLGRRSYSIMDHSSYFGLSAFFAIFLLLLKPVMLLFLNKVRQDRLGENTSPTFGGWGVGGNAASVPGYMPVGEEQIR
ncbi:unnamed protein product [Adineta steineri]|uniref:Uncharacterized protein n=1 Tax=Adineta steineri TaxID=433720 RepID=A0A814F9U6_9BILA|nr:unnamed protein product [Adineta steineri]CAF0943941.1 unnamed protein product [Adineta steineri]CAF0977799.1 unnamed protein product [Adineta steineri]